MSDAERGAGVDERAEVTDLRQTDSDRRTPLCPRHHADLAERRGPTVFCRACGHGYRPEDLLAAGRERGAASARLKRTR